MSDARWLWTTPGASAVCLLGNGARGASRLFRYHLASATVAPGGKCTAHQRSPSRISSLLATRRRSQAFAAHAEAHAGGGRCPGLRCEDWRPWDGGGDPSRRGHLPSPPTASGLRLGMRWIHRCLELTRLALHPPTRHPRRPTQAGGESPCQAGLWPGRAKAGCGRAGMTRGPVNKPSPPRSIWHRSAGGGRIQ